MSKIENQFVSKIYDTNILVSLIKCKILAFYFLLST